MQSLEQIQNTFLNLLNKANRSGAFELEDSNSAILALNALAQVINQQNQPIKGNDIVTSYNKQSSMANRVDSPSDPPPGNGLPHDPSKP